MTDPTRRNRLDEEGSPYLRQHADNPVHWQPWDEAALAAARERDVPVFLSIGYSACHWCHVMEEESFADEGIAAVLNEHFVPVKVDREERPDLDDLYMTVCQLVRGGGGWPLSVWLTPEGKPFYVGTYFPKDARANQPGFRQLLEDVAEAWRTDRESIEERAEQWMAAAKGELEDVPDAHDADPPGSDLLESAADAALRSADREHGGFGSSPKFPQPWRAQALLRAADRTGRDDYREVALDALDAMAAGGLRDHVGGGFHRYCTDRDWTVPHFEKMLYDQADLVRAFLDGYRVAGDERYADAVRGTLAFVERELRHPEGGFYSTLDARSPDPETGEQAEGAFYVWTPDAAREAMSRDEGDAPADADPDLLADLFCERYGVDEAGNFEGDTVLTLAASVEDLADERDLPAERVESFLDAARERAFAARAERPRPGRDEKVIGAWNGLAISAFADAGLALDPGHAETAADALAFVRERLWDAGERRLARRHIDGDVAGEGYLEDYAFLARGALDVYQATGDVDALGFAVDLARVVVEAFYDADAGALYFTPADGEDIGARPQELADTSTPSPTGVAVETLLLLDPFAPDAGFAEAAERTLATHRSTVEERPVQYATLATAAETRAVGPLELTVAGDLPDDWRERIGRAYLPDRLLSRRPPTEDGLAEWLAALDLASAPPVWAGREARDGGPTCYVCRRSCSPPLADLDDVMEWVEDFRPR